MAAVPVMTTVAMMAVPPMAMAIVAVPVIAVPIVTMAIIVGDGTEHKCTRNASRDMAAMVSVMGPRLRLLSEGPHEACGQNHRRDGCENFLHDFRSSPGEMRAVAPPGETGAA